MEVEKYILTIDQSTSATKLMFFNQKAELLQRVSIGAVVIGGTSLSSGKGTILGTVQGALIIGIWNNGLVLLNVSPFWQ